MSFPSATGAPVAVAPPLPTIQISRGPALLAISISTTLFALVTCGARFVVRVRLNRRLGWDDYTIVVAMIMGLVGMVFTILEALSTDDGIRGAQFDYLSQPWLMFGSTLAKISVCFFFLRTIGRRRPWNILLGLLIVLLAIVNLAFALISNLQCQPLEKLWKPTVPGSCFDKGIEMNLGFFQGGFAVFTFFFLATFPIVIVRDVGIIHSIRWPFYVLSGASLMAGVLSIVRTYQTSIIGARSSFSDDMILATILGLLIQSISITAANILAFGPLFSPAASALSLATSDLKPINRSPSTRSSFISIKRSTTLIIEGPRKMDDPDRNPRLSVDVEAFAAGGAFVEGGWGMDVLNKGILRTISVEVTEEDITDAEREAMAKKESDDWKSMLRGP